MKTSKLALLMSTALAVPLYAVDGVVLINQSTALAGNVTPGDTPGFPITISVSGSYRLSGNLTVPDANTDAILITTSNVTIDLNGFSILGPTSCGLGPPLACSNTGKGVGVHIPLFTQQNNITVMNGIVQGMGSDGIQVFGTNTRIEKVQTLSNGGAGIMTLIGDGTNSIVSSCMASRNGGDGMFGATVIGSLASYNIGSGIIFGDGVASDNTSSFNHGDGIRGSGTIVSNSTVSNGSAGINADCPSIIAQNRAFFNAGGNIFTSGSGCVLASNAAP